MNESNQNQRKGPATPEEAEYPVPAWVARVEQALLILAGLIIIGVGLAQAFTSMLSGGTSTAFSIILGVAIIAVGSGLCWRMLQTKTYQLLRKGELSLLHFIIG